MDIPRTPYYAPRQPADSFQAFFGLVPRQRPRTKPAAKEMFDPIKALQQDNAQYIQSQLKTAEALFAKATSPGVENREELLSQTQRVLLAVVRLQPDSYEAQLLLVNVALMRQQLMQALCYLKQLVARRPTIFVEQPALARYFGDYRPPAKIGTGSGATAGGRSRAFEKLMRDNLRIGDDNPGMAEFYALQAYCAWALNDRVRLRQALDRIEKTSFAAEASESMRRVRYALAATLRR